MATERQIEANRRNALLSTGPKSVEGKAIVGGNAIKHGILTNKIFIHEESEAEFASMREGFYREFQPQGDLEIFLLERVISCAWRLALITQVETEMYRGDFSRDKPKTAFEGSPECMMAIARYENSIERGFHRAVAAFRQAQLNRADVINIGFVP